MANFARVREHLEARGFTVSCFATAAEACDYLDRTLDGAGEESLYLLL